jgi:DNA-binding transcriptional ArsR family regulator
VTDEQWASRIADLEARVAALEAAPASRPAVPGGDGSPDGSGEIGYQGTVALHGEVQWTIRYSPAATLQLDSAGATGVLAALGHPVRVAVLRQLLSGPAVAAELQEAAGLSSTGQLYHHLRALTSARVAEQDGRGRYRVPPRAVVPVLVLLLAGADVAGELHSAAPDSAASSSSRKSGPA